MPALTTNGRVSIAFFASTLDVCLNFLYANFSDRQTFEERVELVHAEEAFFDTAVFGLPMIEAGWSICAVVIQQDTLQVFVANPSDLGGKRSEEHTSELQSRFDLV